MNEPKKRGRPSKAELEARANAQVEGGDVMPSGVVRLTADEVAADIERGVRVMLTTDETVKSVSQAYANKVWAKQSPSLERGSRLYRVKMALEAQGLSMDGVVL